MNIRIQFESQADSTFVVVELEDPDLFENHATIFSPAAASPSKDFISLSALTWMGGPYDLFVICFALRVL